MRKTIRKWLGIPEQEPSQERDMKDLLRENLGLIPIDVFYIDDPVTAIQADKRVDYYRKFYEICKDRDVMDRFKFLINRQALVMMAESSKSGSMDGLGGININGMASVKDDFTKQANSFLKEMPAEEHFNKHSVI